MNRDDDGKPQDKNVLRAQAEVLLSQARTQSGEIYRALTQANGNPELRARLEALTADVDGVVAELSDALGARTYPLRLADLMSLQTAMSSGEVHAAVSEAANQAAGANGGATRAQVAEVAASSAETRHEVETLGQDLFEKHIFNRYLHFRSPEGEAAFRAREADAQRYIRPRKRRKAISTPAAARLAICSTPMRTAPGTAPSSCLAGTAWSPRPTASTPR